METRNLSDSDKQKIQTIRAGISAASDDLRRRHRWLRHQNAIGALIMAGSIAGAVASGWAYVAGVIPWYVCIPLTAVFLSFIHELEHDLIHQLYFRNSPRAYNLMMALCWITRPSTISPWVRKRMHLHHHKYSGTESDIEERGITNGERWGLRRLIMTGDNMLAVYLRPKTMYQTAKAFIRAQNPTSQEEVKRLAREQRRGYFPLGLMHYLLWHSFVLFHLVNGVALLIGNGIPLSAGMEAAIGLLNTTAVVYLGPNMLRTFCLHFISSNMHYYGDVEAKNIIQQTQVLNVWWMAPLQLFCFNFGSTHAIHHFVVKEPFYIRQATARAAHRVMRENGVRFNDLGTFRRANRYAPEHAEQPSVAVRPSESVDA
ncbi:fatty acid desaturase [uncultured Abyssibacter sp.]|uniref:fatty acid desaturase n=1 Tax=uncultured Abyssibacter sp. TaxID=2320202 RepID=UPI0032B1EA32